jgi:hypothetical protein
VTVTGLCKQKKNTRQLLAQKDLRTAAAARRLFWAFRATYLEWLMQARRQSGRVVLEALLAAKPMLGSKLCPQTNAQSHWGYRISGLE